MARKTKGKKRKKETGMGKLTVFVLGAGASAPFNYPLGSKLVEEVLGFNPDSASGLTKQELEPFRFGWLLTECQSNFGVKGWVGRCSSQLAAQQSDLELGCFTRSTNYG
jgi:hypothetical protein